MPGFERQYKLLRPRNHVVGGVHGRRRAGLIVIAPSVDHRDFDAPGEVDHVIIGGRLQLLLRPVRVWKARSSKYSKDRIPFFGMSLSDTTELLQFSYSSLQRGNSAEKYCNRREENNRQYFSFHFLSPFKVKNFNV